MIRVLLRFALNLVLDPVFGRQEKLERRTDPYVAFHDTQREGCAP